MRTQTPTPTPTHPPTHTHTPHSLLHEMVVDELGHDGADGHGSRTLVKDLGNVLVLQTNHVLAVHFAQVVVDKEAVPEGERNTVREGLKTGEV